MLHEGVFFGELRLRANRAVVTLDEYFGAAADHEAALGEGAGALPAYGARRLQIWVLCNDGRQFGERKCWRVPRGFQNGHKTDKSFLVLFFKKELLPSFIARSNKAPDEDRDPRPTTA
jgi:hypothetical protein